MKHAAPIVLAAALLASAAPAARAQDAPARALPTLAVVGLSTEVGHDEWQDLRIGMGLRAILSQLLFETGEFELLEEKAEIRDRLRDLSAGIWLTGIDPDALPDSLGMLEPDYAAYGKVVYFGRPRSRASVGPVTRHRQSIEIGVEITLMDPWTGGLWTGQGRGEARTVARSAFFVYQEDRAELDESAVGIATREAMAQAVAKLMEGW